MAGRTAGEAVAASLRKRRHGDADLTEYHTRQAERYAERLGRSRGVLMKAGQILSFVSLDSGVENSYRGIYQAAFARLQDDAPPMPEQLLVATITAELGRSIGELFAEFDSKPLAAASIGQVHAATMHDGRRVAVKVQYPGVEEAIRADLANTELLATFFQMVLSIAPGMPRMDVRGMAGEVAARIGEEIDYRIEAKNQQEFAEAFRGHPFIRIPEVLPGLSTRRVLTMELVDGLRYAKALSAEQSLREAWGEAIFRFVCDNLYLRGLFNADPHPGNYLFHPDGAVTFLDFGCVKRFTAAQVQNLLEFIDAAIAQDPVRFMRAAVTTGFVDPADPPDSNGFLAAFSATRPEFVGPQPFTYTPERAAEVLRIATSRHGPHAPAMNKLRTQAEYTLITRFDTGLTAVLGGLHATGPWRAIRSEYAHGSPPATGYGELDLAYRQAKA
jgi:predicted unusual protein kinase regulating ubiquinone biosynthesis (AarF/ABC1/UbiB family)